MYLARDCFSIPVTKVYETDFFLLADKAKNKPFLFSISILIHNLICKELDCISLPQDITLIYYTDDIMLIGPSKQEVTNTLL
jgi:hypothetical protein